MRTKALLESHWKIDIVVFVVMFCYLSCDLLDNAGGNRLSKISQFQKVIAEGNNNRIFFSDASASKMPSIVVNGRHTRILGDFLGGFPLPLSKVKNGVQAGPTEGYIGKLMACQVSKTRGIIGSLNDCLF